MRVMFINNHGSGYSDYVEIPHGTTVGEFFAQRMSAAKPDQYLIRVNRQSVPRDQVLCEGDRVSFTPTKIEGARL
jgi:sulfur carrier protein ThiS